MIPHQPLRVTQRSVCDKGSCFVLSFFVLGEKDQLFTCWLHLTKICVCLYYSSLFNWLTGIVIMLAHRSCMDSRRRQICSTIDVPVLPLAIPRRSPIQWRLPPQLPPLNRRRFEQPQLQYQYLQWNTKLRCHFSLLKVALFPQFGPPHSCIPSL